jgi:transcriptional regulator with AAA-type ATPase domain
MITVKDLLSINIFTGFPPGTFEKIIPRIDQKTFSAGTMIIYRGDPGYSMFMILEGTVAITLKNNEGIEYTINTLGEGEVFGEMALMTGEPRSANVKALTDVCLAELYQDAFFELIVAHPKLNENFLRMLVQRRAKTTIRWQFANLEREEIIARLNSQEPPEIDFLIGKTKWTNDVNAEIKRLASVEKNILIHGERGTGKNLAARLIQFHSQAQSWAIFNLDCANPPPIQREIKAKSKEKMDALHLEIAQETALFGHSYDAGGFAKSIRRGYIELANGGAVILENIEALSARVQHLLTEYLREGTFVRKGETQHISSSVRLISTTSMSLQELKKQGNLNPELLTLISGEILHMKPLRDRKKDIPVIAKHFLQEYNHKFTKRITGFTEEALIDIVDHSWPLNIDELHQVIERAVAITEDHTITSSQVFLTPFLFSTEGRFNLLRIPLLRKLVNHPMFPKGSHMVSVPFILVLILDRKSTRLNSSHLVDHA